MEAIRLDKVSFTYPDCSQAALTDVSFAVNKGELVLLCGASGSGKSTLLRLLKKQLSPHGTFTGSISIDGKNIDDMTDRESVSQIGFVMQNCEAQLVAENVMKELAFGLESLGAESSSLRRRAAETAMYFGLEKRCRQKCSTLSGGEKQLLALASVMTCEPSVLLLDEPTSQLDPITAKSFLSNVFRLNRELGITVMISEHRCDEIFPVADRVICLDEGKVIVDDTPSKAVLNSNIFNGSLPTSARLFRELDNKIIPITVTHCRQLISEDYDITEIPVKNREKTPCVIKLRDVYFRYERRGKDVLNGLSLDICKGEVLAILGGNGAGKSTLLRLISGVEKSSGGKINAKGVRIALLPQDPREMFLENTLQKDFEEAAKGHATEINALCNEFGIAHLLNRHPYDLSGGEQQKAALVKLLLTEPDVLLLDEPTKGMDLPAKQNAAKLFSTLAISGKAVVVVTHDTQTAALCADRCALLFDGETLSQGDPRSFFSGLSYYTTQEARISRGLIPNAVTINDITASLKRKKTG